MIHALTGGGAERVMVTLMNAFVEKGYDISLLTDTDTPFAYEISSKIHLYNITEGYPHNENSFARKVQRYIRKLYNIRKTANRVGPDVVISFLCEMNYDVIAANLLSGRKIVCSEHTNILYKFPRRVRALRNIFYPLASCVTVLTKHDYSIWKNKFSNCVYMPNPIGLKPPGQNAKEKFVLSAGRVSNWWHKGFDNLLRSWGLICRNHPDWSLCIAGGGDEDSMNHLKRLSEEYLCTNVHFLGFRSDIADLMRRASIFCLSSRIEGLPMVLIEAMNAGCCCVSFDCTTGPREIITHGKDGVLVEDQNINAFSEQLDLVIQNDKLRETLSSKATYAIEKYSTECIVNRWVILLNKVILR